MTETTVNTPLLRKAVEWAEAEAAKPDGEGEWAQEWWILPVDRSDPALHPDSWMPDAALLARTRELHNACGTQFCIAGWTVHSNGELVRYDGAAERAAQLLGIDEEQAERLFYSGNSISDVRRIAEDIAGERL